jgi:multiple sugar transport system permease protein/raffinose/stachyose/melibiose transport system permease protein
MLVPTTVIYTIFIMFSIIIAGYYSFTKYSGIGKAYWLGFANYLRIFGDRYFVLALKNSLTVLIFSTLLLIVLGFFLASLFKMKLFGNGFSKACIFSPAIIAPIIVGIIWVFIFDPEIGAINALLRATGHGNLTQAWIGGDKLSPLSFALVFFWRQLGYFATIYLAGLNLIPEEIYESAAIDGAGVWRRMWYITIPLMKQTFTITILLAITEVFKIFEIVLQLTNGGPNHLSEVLVTYTYITTFKGGEYGYGMALAIIIFIIMFIFSFTYMFVSTKNNREGAA